VILKQGIVIEAEIFGPTLPRGSRRSSELRISREQMSVSFIYMPYNVWYQLNRVNAMSKLIWLPLLLVFALSTPAYAKDKESSLEKAVRDDFRDDDHPGKGKGRPDNPGEHGRENAAEKQSQSHGKGSKKGESWEDKIRDEFDDEDDKDKGKDKKKNKKK